MTKEEFTAFVMLVAQMRTAQVAYFKERSPQWLGRAKEAERKVDKALKDFGEGQGSLFDAQH